MHEYMSELVLPWISASLLLLFAGVAAVDGVWLHLWKLRLHARPASYAEHLWHTASAVLFLPTVLLLFVAQPSGPLLWLGVAFLLAVHVVEVLDARAERASRRELGGLSRFELTLHIAAVASRTLAVAALFLAQPASIWAPWAATSPDALPSVIARAGELVAIGAAVVAVLHVSLAALYCPVPCCGDARTPTESLQP
jgi:hypothetical protein